MPDVEMAAISITEVAEATVFLEAAEPYLGTSRIELGDTITDPAFRAFLGAVHQTQAVRSFTLRDTILHAPTMLLFSGDRMLAETRDQVPDKAYEARASPCHSDRGDVPVVIGFNMDWWGYYHWVVQCLPAIDWALRRGANALVRMALPRLGGWSAELLDLLGYSGVERVEIDRDSLLCPAACIYSEHLNGSTSFGVSRSAVQTFQLLCKRARVPPASHEIIYVAGTDMIRRPMRNEAALIHYLESEGVAIVVPGPLSVADQIALFRGAGSLSVRMAAGLPTSCSARMTRQ